MRPVGLNRRLMRERNSESPARGRLSPPAC